LPRLIDIGFMIKDYKTESEKLFANYLNSNGLVNFEYERAWEHTNSKPDFYLNHDNNEIVCDVTEFEYRKNRIENSLQNVGSEVALDNLFGGILKEYSPNKPLRRKIIEKHNQLKEFGEMCCNLIIQIKRHPFWFESPRHVYEAMYGDLKTTLVTHKPTGQSRYFQSFGRDGKLRENEKTYLSSVIMLKQITEIDIGLIVFENFYAKHKLPTSLFCGDFDVRYGIDDDFIKQTFVGKELQNDSKVLEYKDFKVSFHK
jgi:hypothetical protein